MCYMHQEKFVRGKKYVMTTEKRTFLGGKKYVFLSHFFKEYYKTRGAYVIPSAFASTNG